MLRRAVVIAMDSLNKAKPMELDPIKVAVKMTDKLKLLFVSEIN